MQQPALAHVASATALPPVFVGVRSGRLAVYSSNDGAFRRWLTGDGGEVGVPSISPDHRWVYFVKVNDGNPCPGTFRVPLAGGTAQLVRTGPYGGAQPIATGPSRALAGTTSCIASRFLVARDGDGVRHYIGGVRYNGMHGLSWAPDGRRLAVSTSALGVRVINVKTVTAIDEGRRLPCPSSMPRCTTTAGSFAPGGWLYYVAVNQTGTAASIVRRSGSAAVTIVRLPRMSPRFHLTAYSSGQLLISGDADAGTMTSSHFVARWNGVSLRRLRQTMVQPTW